MIIPRFRKYMFYVIEMKLLLNALKVFKNREGICLKQYCKCLEYHDLSNTPHVHANKSTIVCTKRDM